MTADPPPRTLPVRLRPLDDEPLESWLAAYAQRLAIRVSDLVNALGLSPAVLSQPGLAIATGKGIGDPGSLLAASGLSIDEADALWQPLSAYVALVDARVAPGLASGLRPLRWSRFCPACLQATNGRWKLTWRLPWHAACGVHRCLLASACPGCGGRQRNALPRFEAHTATCWTTYGRARRGCGQDLRAGSSSPAPPGVVTLQQRLLPLVDTTAADETRSTCLDTLVDVLTMALVAGLDATPDGIGELASDVVAGALDDAYRALTTDTERFTDLALRDVRTQPHPLPRSCRAATPALTARLLAARDRYLRPTDRIRWRTTTGGSRPTATAPGAWTSSIPTALWPEWVVRLRPPTSESTTFAKLGAALLLLPGAAGPVRQIFESWTPRAEALVGAGRHLLRTVVSNGQGEAVLRAFTQLSDRLQTEGAPIDYRRREDLATDAVLMDASAWDRICAGAGTRTGKSPKLRCAQLWTWETITGGLVECAPERLRPSEPAGLIAYHSFALRLPPLAAGLLDDHARRLLDQWGCADEPTTWTPPSEWVELEGLPGRDPDSITAAEVGPLLRQGLAPTEVAQRLDTSIDHVRLIVRRTPPQVRLPNSGRRTSPVRLVFPAALTPERLHELVVVEHRSLRAIGDAYAVSKGALADALRREGIAVPVPGRPPTVSIDEGWLRREYIESRRTLGDIADELGTAPTNVSRAARGYGIRVRRGGASPRSVRAAHPDWPDLLVAAAVGQGGMQRVQRFQVLARTRSINQAVEILSASPSSLSNQIACLERACGGALLHRSTRRHAPQRLTALGQRLLQQADTHLGRHPLAPPALPEPLATVAGQLRGTGRVQRFQVAARAPTVAEAAAIVGAEPHVLNKSIMRLEKACGGVLLDRDGVLTRHRVTPLGRKLLRQADRYLPLPQGATLRA